MNATVRTQLSKGLLAAGLCAISIAALIAHYSPATGYELSIYRATPMAFWVALLISLLASVAIAFATERRRLRSLALWLGGISMTLLTALPLVRGYYFFGPEDALTHLGIAKSLARGSIELTDTTYPAIHTFAAVVGTFTGRPLTWSLLLVVPVFVAIFIVFIALCSRLISGRSKIDPIAVLSGMLLLPITSLYLPVLQPIPTSEAILFVPATAFVLLAYVRRRRRFVFGMLLVLALAFLVVLHPQHALVFGAMLAVVLFTQFIAQTTVGDVEGIEGIATLFVQFVVVAAGGLAVVWVWLSTQSLFGRGINQLAQPLFSVQNATQLQTFFANHSTEQIIAELLNNPSRPIVPRSDTLSRLGVSARTLYRRVFAVDVVYGVFAVLALFIPVLSRLTNRRGIRYSVVVSLICGLFPASVLIALYVLAGLPIQYFRYLGFALVFVTILGAVFLHEARATLERWWSKTPVRGLLIVGFIILLVFSSFAMFRSPYIYQPTEHVPQGQVSGYETAFTHRAADIPFAGIDSAIYRYHAGIHGAEAPLVPTAPFDNPRSSGAYARVPPHFGEQSLQAQIEQPIYLTVTASDRQTSTRLYAGTDFSRADFAYLDSTPGIAKVQSNGQFDLYLVHQTNTTSS
jgi:hypothetical protein